jgi:predicted transcriptional regulator
MKALADPGRIKIVKMLEARELCVCEIHAALDLAQPTISCGFSRRRGWWTGARMDSS